jgi:hypothetical protein
MTCAECLQYGEAFAITTHKCGAIMIFLCTLILVQYGLNFLSIKASTVLDTVHFASLWYISFILHQVPAMSCIKVPRLPPILGHMKEHKDKANESE